MNRVRAWLVGAVSAGVCIGAFAATADATVPTYIQPGLQQHGRAKITAVHTCKHTGLKGPNGAITIWAFAIKSKHPAKASESCSLGKAAVKAGMRYVIRDTKAIDYVPGEKEPPKATFGETVRAKGIKYKVDKFEWGGGILPCFVAGGVVFAISY